MQTVVTSVAQKSKVTRQDITAQLEILRGRVIDPKVGLFGPDSMMWEVGRHSTVFWGAGVANSLQLAHPWVAQAIDQHSKTQVEPLARLRRTFLNVWAMVYGDLDHVVESAYRVHRIHDGIRGKLSETTGSFAAGSGYIANHVGSLIWVHATLWHTAVQMYEMFQRPLTRAEKEQFYRETKLFAFLFGVPEKMLPATWDDFTAYVDRMVSSDELAVGDVARKLSDYIFSMRWYLNPLLSVHRFHTGMMLPDRISEGFRLPKKTPARLRALKRDVAVVKTAMKLAPAHVRYIPPYLEALARIEGKKADVITRTANYAILGVPTVGSAG